MEVFPKGKKVHSKKPPFFPRRTNPKRRVRPKEFKQKKGKYLLSANLKAENSGKFTLIQTWNFLERKFGSTL